jgi:hypothetical protein
MKVSKKLIVGALLIGVLTLVGASVAIAQPAPPAVPEVTPPAVPDVGGVVPELPTSLPGGDLLPLPGGAPAEGAGDALAGLPGGGIVSGLLDTVRSLPGGAAVADLVETVVSLVTGLLGQLGLSTSSLPVGGLLPSGEGGAPAAGGLVPELPGLSGLGLSAG